MEVMYNSSLTNKYTGKMKFYVMLDNDISRVGLLFGFSSPKFIRSSSGKYNNNNNIYLTAIGL